MSYIYKQGNKRKLKSSVLTIADMFDIEKLWDKEPRIFQELCEKYPLKTEQIYVIQCLKGETIASEVDSANKEPKNEEPSFIPPTEEKLEEVTVDTAIGEIELPKETAEVVTEDEPEQETVETEDAATPSEPSASNDDFSPLYKSAEHITIKYDYGRVVEKLTILEAIPVYKDTVITAYDYKVIVERGSIEIYHEDFLVENEVLEE